LIDTPRLLHVSSGCLGGVPELLLKHGFDSSTVWVGSGSGPSSLFAEQIVEGLSDAGMRAVHREDLDGTLAAAARAAAQIIGEEVSLVIGVGGGRVLDTAKLAAARTGTEFVSVPTALAHDGISSPVASLIGKDGRRQSFAAAMPAGIVVDLGLIGAAPPRSIRSGVGDLVSNLTAVLDWRLADAHGHDRYDAFAAIIAESAARPILGLHDVQRPDDREVLANGLILSGLAMAAAGTSRPCSGAEHLISHSLDQMETDTDAMHGEQVALGCLLSAAAHDHDLLLDFRRLFTAVGLPLHPEDLGISEDQMLEAILAAPECRPDRYTILSESHRDRESVYGLMETAFSPVREKARSWE
jgi:glycerol-1-phosphate dehydrogenase [NAD(P)+]